jgi:hypothetical protein
LFILTFFSFLTFLPYQVAFKVRGAPAAQSALITRLKATLVDVGKPPKTHPRNEVVISPLSKAQVQKDSQSKSAKAKPREEPRLPVQKATPITPAE